MARPKSDKPAYCLHKSSGRAFVKIDGHRFYLGTHGTQASRDKYDVVIGQWKARGRNLPAPPAKMKATDAVLASSVPMGKTIVEVIESYWTFAEGYYRHADGTPTDEIHCIRAALRVLNKLFGDMEADKFNSLNLEAAQQHMIETGWSRKTINDHIGRIRRAFKWMAKKKLVSNSVFAECLAVDGLQRGRSKAKETERKRPVPPELIDAVEPHVSEQVWAMIQLQLHSLARPGQIVKLRKRDIDRSTDVWEYRPEEHKTTHHGHDRLICFGPDAQAVLAPFLMRPDDVFLFSPAEAERNRRKEQSDARETPPELGNAPGTNRKKNPKRSAGEKYTVDSYRRAVERGILKAFPIPAELLEPTAEQAAAKPAIMTAENTAARKRARDEWKHKYHWHPHRLRHNAGTNIREKYGAEAAKLVLGVKSLDVADIYAERDEKLVRKIIGEVG